MARLIQDYPKTTLSVWALLEDQAIHRPGNTPVALQSSDILTRQSSAVGTAGARGTRDVLDPAAMPLEELPSMTRLRDHVRHGRPIPCAVAVLGTETEPVRAGFEPSQLVLELDDSKPIVEHLGLHASRHPSPGRYIPAEIAICAHLYLEFLHSFIKSDVPLPGVISVGIKPAESDTGLLANAAETNHVSGSVVWGIPDPVVGEQGSDEAGLSTRKGHLNVESCPGRWVVEGQCFSGLCRLREGAFYCGASFPCRFRARLPVYRDEAQIACLVPEVATQNQDNLPCHLSLWADPVDDRVLHRFEGQGREARLARHRHSGLGQRL